MPEYIDLNACIADLVPMLGAASSSNADLCWWTTGEFFQWFDEAGLKLAREAGVFVAYDQSLLTAATIATYTLPAQHIATVQADIDGYPLRPMNNAEVEALDASWTWSAAELPNRYLQDQDGLNSITFYPYPTVAGRSIGLVMHEWPPSAIPSPNHVSAPTVFQDFFTFSALAEAHAKETRGAKPELVQWVRQLTNLYESTVTGIWGRAT